MAAWADNLAAFNDDAISFFDMEETTGVVVDSSPEENDGALTGATRGVTGKIGNGFEFSDSGDYIQISNTISGTAYSFAGWWTAPSTILDRDYILFSVGSSGSEWFYFGYCQETFRSGTSSARFYFYDSGWQSYGDTGDTVTAGTTNHFAYTTNGTTSRIYLNGTEVFNTANFCGPGSVSLIRVGGNMNSSSDRSADGMMDIGYIWDAEISASAVSDLYNGGSGLEYVPVSGHSWEPALLEDDLKDGHSWVTTLLAEERQGHSWEPVLLDKDKDGHSWPLTLLLDEKQGHSWQEALLAEEKQGHSWSPGRLRATGEMSYFFDLRDSDDVQVATATGAPPTTVFTDVFTGVADGKYILYVRSVEKFTNFKDIVNETFAQVELVSGLLVLPTPNEILSLDGFPRAGGDMLLTWNYDPTNESVAPDSFEIYIDAVFDSSVSYTGATTYRTTLPALSAGSKVFKVTAKAATQETTGLSVTRTPDAIPPTSVDFTFEVE